MLEAILRKHEIAYALITKSGNFAWAETAGEAGRYKKGAFDFAKTYSRFLKNLGAGLITFLGRDKKYLRKNFHGVGAVRYTPTNGRIVAAMTYHLAKPHQRYIVGNGYGSFSEGIDQIVSDHGWSRGEALEYVLTEETTHLARPKWSESKVAEAMFLWYANRAANVKDEHTQQKYMNMADVANKRYQSHRKSEGKKARDLFSKHKVKKGHNHDGHGEHNGHVNHGKKGHYGHGGHNGHGGHHTQSYQQKSAYHSRPQYNKKAA